MPVDLIPPSEIHAELKRIWESQEGQNKMRASLFNLIFYTEKNTHAEYIQAISQNVIEKFPSRVIFITKDPDESKDHLHTGVSVLGSSDGDSDIACDYIEIDVAGKHSERVPFVVLPHILPDLPIYVIWGEDPSQNTPLLTELKKLATRFIFDSEAITDLSQFAHTLLDFQKPFSTDIADLNWARMESWRNLLTSTFYTEERLAKLRKTKTIQILYNAEESPFCCHPQIQALYLQGWLSAQLGWTLLGLKTENDKLTFSYQREGREVTINLYPETQKNLKPGTILSVDLETEDQHHFSFGRDLAVPHHVSMRFSTLEKCDMPLKYIFTKDESGQSLVKEICHKGTSTHYIHLLKSIQDRKEYSLCEY